MGRNANDTGGIMVPGGLFTEDEAPAFAGGGGIRNFKSLRHPLWTESKARLIQEYLKLFTMITKHGTYIDGFAAPQEADHDTMWSAKLVLENQPQWMRDFWLCDMSVPGLARLHELAAVHSHKPRRVTVLPGDFNQSVKVILNSGTITPKKATFALLDQRTFECFWSTVEAIARHKKEMKIEQFYFLATGWIDRSIAATKLPTSEDKIERWWGRGDWRDLRGIGGTERAMLVADRFKSELGYEYAFPFAIHSKKQGGRVMYHMIHASDHPEAALLMIRAYRKVSGRSELSPGDTQGSLESLWADLEAFA